MIRSGLLLALALLTTVAGSPARAQSGAEAVRVAAQEAIAEVWEDAQVEVVRLSGGAEEAAAPLRVRFRDDAPRGRTSAEVKTLVDGAWTALGWAYLDVAVFETVPVLTADVERGEPIEGFVRLDRVETTRLPGVPASGALGEGWTARRSLRAGTVLTDRLVEPPAAVERGAPLRVRYDRGAIAVTLACQARERGAVGETVRAVCSDTRSTYRVQLTAPGEGDWTSTL